jgi:uncharacterized protein (TIGR02284 family)
MRGSPMERGLQTAPGMNTHHIETALHVPKDVIQHLNELIQLDFDAARTYEQALERVDDPLASEDLESFREDHERHISELTRVVEDLGGEVEEAGRDVKGVLLESMTKLRSVTGTLGALKAMRLNEKLTNRTYEKATREDLPPIALEVVARNLEDERRHLAAIEEHIERLGAGPIDPNTDIIDIDEEDMPSSIH